MPKRKEGSIPKRPELVTLRATLSNRNRFVKKVTLPTFTFKTESEYADTERSVRRA